MFKFSADKEKGVILMEPADLFYDIYEQNHQAIYSFFLAKTSDGKLAEDLMQDVFLRAWQNINSLREGSLSRQKSWLFKVARNRLIDHYRHQDVKKKNIQQLNPGESLTDSSQEEISQKVFTDNLLKRLDQEIARLPEAERTIIHLKIIGELSSREIGEMLEMPAGTVRYKLHQIRKKLKDKLGLDSSSS